VIWSRKTPYRFASYLASSEGGYLICNLPANTKRKLK
jgi:hypothetical protein